MNRGKLYFIFVLIFVHFSAYSQVKVLLTNGKLMGIDSLKSVDAVFLANKNIFSILYPYHTEKIIYGEGSSEAGKMILYNGKIVPFRNIVVEENKVKFIPSSINKSRYPETLPTQNKEYKSLNMDDVFSISYNNGQEKVLYSPDTSFSGELNIEEMRLFISGQQDAIAFYKNFRVFAGGGISGFAGSYLGFYSFFAPALYLTGIGAIQPQIRKVKALKQYPQSKINNPEYISGFQKKAKEKNVKNGAKGALIGLLSGIAFFHLVYAK